MKGRRRSIPDISPVESLPIVHELSDANKLLWERYYGPMQAAAQALNAAIVNTQNLLARIIIEREGFEPDEHVFDMDRLVIRSRPKEG